MEVCMLGCSLFAAYIKVGRPHKVNLTLSFIFTFQYSKIAVIIFAVELYDKHWELSCSFACTFFFYIFSTSKREHQLLFLSIIHFWFSWKQQNNENGLTFLTNPSKTCSCFLISIICNSIARKYAYMPRNSLIYMHCTRDYITY